MKMPRLFVATATLIFGASACAGKPLELCPLPGGGSVACNFDLTILQDGKKCVFKIRHDEPFVEISGAIDCHDIELRGIDHD